MLEFDAAHVFTARELWIGTEQLVAIGTVRFAQAVSVPCELGWGWGGV